MTILAVRDPSGSGELAFGIITPTAQARSREAGHRDRRFPLPSLAFLCGLVALGRTKAGAADIQGHAQNILRAVARAHNPCVGAQAPSRLNPNTRSIQRDTAGETAATRSLK
jgi:hypothetical protein